MPVSLLIVPEWVYGSYWQSFGRGAFETVGTGAGALLMIICGVGNYPGALAGTLLFPEGWGWLFCWGPFYCGASGGAYWTTVGGITVRTAGGLVFTIGPTACV